jgi:hypothetical protein
MTRFLPRLRSVARGFLQGAAVRAGYRIEALDAWERDVLPLEFDARDREIFHYVLERGLTMAPPRVLAATIHAANHVVRAEIPGDFVECGVWRGGNALAAHLVFEKLGAARAVWLFDTFSGMTEPDDVDVGSTDGVPARATYEQMARTGDGWCLASLEDVEHNFREAGADSTRARMIVGDVLETLADGRERPEAISLLRLDTDWYRSTLRELEVLYPILSPGGVLIIDDYGRWEGARRAVDEYFSGAGRTRPFLQIVHSDGCRMGVR